MYYRKWDKSSGSGDASATNDDGSPLTNCVIVGCWKKEYKNGKMFK